MSVEFEHPWPWSFQIYRAESGGPMVPLESTESSPFDDTTAVPGTSYDYWVSTRTAIDGESTAAGPVTGVRAIPVCGNDVTEAPAEDCDDGNTTAGDGCAADCTDEVPLDEVASTCVRVMNDLATRVSKAQGKENLACLVAAASGNEPDADACIAADAMQKVAKARAKAEAADAAYCVSPPPFGYADSATACDAAENERRAFLTDLFGTDVSAALLTKASDPEGSTCQRVIGKLADKVLANELAVFLSCKKVRLKTHTISAPESIEACFDEVTSEAADQGSRLGMTISKLATTRLRKCAGVDLAAAFPGRCSTAIGTAFDDCLAASAACRTCRTYDLADGVARDCDLFDNGASDGSCPL